MTSQEIVLRNETITLDATQHGAILKRSVIDLTSKEGYLIKFCMKLIAAISHDNYYSQIFHSFCEIIDSFH
jgi:hypothetical protein